jgi:hypothetical protein
MSAQKPTHPAIECAKNGSNRVQCVEDFAGLRDDKNAY